MIRFEKYRRDGSAGERFLDSQVFPLKWGFSSPMSM